MITVNISEFRANLLNFLEKANAGEQISVTTNGRLIATIGPPLNHKLKAKQQLRELASTAKINDVTSPTDEPWEAM